jgi:hypothetical protein
MVLKMRVVRTRPMRVERWRAAIEKTERSSGVAT